MKDITSRLRSIRDTLTTGLIERDVAIRLALLAALSGEHILLLGLPGTAKSLVARRLRLAFADATYFERLLTRFTVPEELFGPLSIKGLEEDRYERLTESYLPTASIAFLDEVFKANSAILNALLTLLNEREFDNGNQRVSTPLTAVIGASNELPEGEELDALFDRFLLRLHVDPVSKKGFPELLKLRGEVAPSVEQDAKLTHDDIEFVQRDAESVVLPDNILSLLRELRDWCIKEDLRVSDRRWRKVVKLLQTSAFTNGRKAVSMWDCWLLQHCLWTTPEDRERLFDWVTSRIGAVSPAPPATIVQILNAWEDKLKRDRGARSQKRDSDGNLLYLRDGDETTDDSATTHAKRGGEKLYRVSEEIGSRGHMSYKGPTNEGKGYTQQELKKFDKFRDYYGDRKLKEFIENEENWLLEEARPAVEPTKHKPAYIKECIQNIAAVRKDIESDKAAIKEQLETIKTDLINHLWVTQDFVEPAGQTLREADANLDKLTDRLAKVEAGYKKLPCDED